MAQTSQQAPHNRTSPPRRQDWSPLMQSLREADQLSQHLQSLLAQERSALEARDYPVFETLLADKNRTLQALEHNTLQRKAWLQQIGYADDRAALMAVDAELPELGKRWRGLATLWQQCQTASRVNDQISQRTRLVVGKLIDILSGNAGQGSTYDGKGTTRRAQSGRTITSA